MQNLFAINLKTKEPTEALVALRDFFKNMEQLDLEECIPSYNAILYYSNLIESKKGVDVVRHALISRAIQVAKEKKDKEFLKRFYQLIKNSGEDLYWYMMVEEACRENW